VEGLSLRFGAANLAVVRDVNDFKLQAVLDWILRFTRSKGRFKLYQFLYGDVRKLSLWLLVATIVIILSLTGVITLGGPVIPMPLAIATIVAGVD
jgi:hypothetical protein